MQEKNAKILGIMENNASLSSSVNSLIEQFEIERESEQDILNSRKLTIQPINTGHRLEITKESETDIDKNITELENLIKRLQAEINLQVEKSATARKPISLYGSNIAQKEESNKSSTESKKQEASYALSELPNKAKEPESHNDGMLEDQVEVCSENTIYEDNQKDAFDDVKRDFSVLWDDTSSNYTTSNLDVAVKTIETGSNKLLNECRYYVLEPSLEYGKSMFKDGISIESTNNKCQIELTNDSKFIDGTCPNVEVFPNTRDTRDEDKKISSNNTLYIDSITSAISELVYEDVTENIMDNVSVILKAENPSNLSDKKMSIEIKESNTEKHPSNVVNKTDLKSSATDLPKPETVAAIKTKIENLGSSDNISAPVPNPVIQTSVTRELPQTQSINTEKTEKYIPKTDSLLKTFNRKLRQIVGITSEKIISQDKHNTEDDFTSDKDLVKAFPKSKSDPQKDFFTSDEDSSKIGPKNTVILPTQDKFKTPNSVYSNIIAAENSMGFINIVKKIIPSLVSNGLPDNKDDPSDNGPLDRNFMKANLITAHNIVNPIGTANESQNLNPKNLVDDKPDESVKNPAPEKGFFGTTNSGFSSMIPKFFGSDIKTEEVMKVQGEEKKVEITEQKEETKEEKKEDVEEIDDEDEDGDDDDDDDDD